MSNFIVLALALNMFDTAGGPIIMAEIGLPNSFSTGFVVLLLLITMLLPRLFEVSNLELFRLGVVARDPFGMLDLLLLCLASFASLILGVVALWTMIGDIFSAAFTVLHVWLLEDTEVCW